ncbi:MAG: Gfo/Idh/MocA family oxidoreductase [Chloroflexi bacterium]|nr:Gfo/Idh/MocA family oxidoreductase [Chloroflexota bacterium]
MTYKCALLGCGPRAIGHIEAYQHVKRGKLIAICDRHEEKVESLGSRFGIAARYTDFAQMLQKERPDVVHIVTQPTHRVDALTIASEYGVPAVIVEKPIAIQGEDYRALCELQAATRTKICVNHQLHFHPRRLELERYVREGHIGEIRFLEASARMNLAYQGTHILELISAFNGGARPIAVFGQVAGAEGLKGTKGHYAPDQCVASIAFANGVRAQLLCGKNAPAVREGPVHTHKRIAVYGTRGLVHWTMKGWERTGADGTLEQGFHNYADEDILGQAGLTEAVFDWLEDESRVHPTNLAASLIQFNIILGIYMSALHHQLISLPVDPEPHLIDALKARLTR